MGFNSNASDRGQAQAIDTGAQVLNLSFGASSEYVGTTYCIAYVNTASCLDLSYAKSRDVAPVASSGNDRIDLQFPASDPRVISAGGFQQGAGTGIVLWDESPPPPNTAHCPHDPNLPLGLECGTNFSLTYAANGYNHQELLGSAQSVYSTTYPYKNWVDYAQCGDGYPSQWGGGGGLCTGTSMSAPQISGVVGLLRSINPLVLTSVPEPGAGVPVGLRASLAQTTAEAQAHMGLIWDVHLGYGHPDAAAAARKMLGKVAGAVIRNRATPLFRLYSSVTKDYADTTSPQYALTLLINQTHDYVQPTSLPAVPGYHFPYDTVNETAPATPRASVYVLTTEVRPRNEWPALVPLYMMDKPKTNGTEYMLVKTTPEIQQAHSSGYNLRTIQGYIYQACTPDCIPPGAAKLWREYKTSDADCATFLNSEKATFEANGYTAACPAGSGKLLGYAYPATDTDSDGLPDGFEYVVGTSLARTDSDGDGVPDETEFPMIGVPISDPCAGGSGARYCLADSLFKYGFEPL